jgi:hypothetical protein
MAARDQQKHGEYFMWAHIIIVMSVNGVGKQHKMDDESFSYVPGKWRFSPENKVGKM